MNSSFLKLINHINRRIILTEDEQQAIIPHLNLRSYLKGQYIVQEGDVSRNETFIVSGKVRSFYLDDKGNEHIVAFGIEDWWINDICSYTTQTPAEFNIQCLEPTEVIQISRDKMEELFILAPKLERYFRLIIQKAYANMSKRIVNNHAQSAKERYLSFIGTYPDIANRVPQYMIASYLGITKEFLSSLRKQIHSDAKS